MQKSGFNSALEIAECEQIRLSHFLIVVKTGFAVANPVAPGSTLFAAPCPTPVRSSVASVCPGTVLVGTVVGGGLLLIPTCNSLSGANSPGLITDFK